MHLIAFRRSKSRLREHRFTARLQQTPNYVGKYAKITSRVRSYLWSVIEIPFINAAHIVVCQKIAF